MNSYYKIQYHKKDEHTDNWYNFKNQYDTKTEAYESLINYLQEKFTVFAHIEIDQFRIVFVNEDLIFTTWKLEAESGR